MANMSDDDRAARGLPASAVPRTQVTPVDVPPGIDPEFIAKIREQTFNGPGGPSDPSAVPPEVTIAANEAAQQADQDRAKQMIADQARKEAPVHPILENLRRDLGIKKVTTEEVEIGGHKWTIRPLDTEDQEWAMSLALTATGGGGRPESFMTFQRALGVAAVSAIDDVPIYEIMGIKVPPQITIDDPNRPPRTIRLESHDRLWVEMRQEMLPDVSLQLNEAYTSKMGPKMNVQSSVTPLQTWICSQEDCRREEVLRPRINEQGNEAAPYCPNCGTEMVMESPMGDAAPLP
jgi:hypothetical protein